MPAMSDAPLRGFNGRHEWLWEPGDEGHIFPLKNLVKMYYQSVGHNSTLIVGLTPDNTGVLPAADVTRLREWGAAIRKRFDNPVASIKGTGKMLNLDLGKPSKVNQVVLQENIAKGHRVRSFILQAYCKGRWQTINSGTAIGHKYIWLGETPVETRKLRLVVTGAVGLPDISNFAVYFVSDND